MREAVKDEQLPERPRLRLGCRVFEDAESVIVRSSEAGFRIEPAHRDAMLRVIERLDGTREFAELLGGEAAADAFYALRMLDSFGHCELLAEGPLVWFEPEPVVQPVRLDGVQLACPELGPMARALADRCAALGASVRASDSPREGETLLLCPDGPDIALSVVASSRIGKNRLRSVGPHVRLADNGRPRLDLFMDELAVLFGCACNGVHRKPIKPLFYVRTTP